MKTPGDYALMAANGMPWKDVVAAIRDEMRNDYACPCAGDMEARCAGSACCVVDAES